MKIQVQCAACGKQYVVPDNLAGRRVKCKNCGKPIEIPVPKPKSEKKGGFDFSELSALEQGTEIKSSQVFQSEILSQAGVLPTIKSNKSYTSTGANPLKWIVLSAGVAVVIVLGIFIVASIGSGGGSGGQMANGSKPAGESPDKKTSTKSVSSNWLAPDPAPRLLELSKPFISLHTEGSVVVDTFISGGQGGMIITIQKGSHSRLKCDEWLAVHRLSNGQVLREFALPKETLYLLDVDPTGSYAMFLRMGRDAYREPSSKSKYQKLEIMSLSTGEMVMSFEPYGSSQFESERSVNWARFLDDSHFLTFSKGGDKLSLWKTGSDQPLNEHSMHNHNALALSPGKNQLAVLNQRGLTILDPRTFQTLAKSMISLIMPYESAQFSPDGTILLAVAAQTYGVWDMATGGLDLMMESGGIPGRQFYWCNTDRFLTDGGILYDLSYRTPVWRYRIHQGIARGNPTKKTCFIYRVRDSSDYYLCQTDIPGKQVEEKIKNKLSRYKPILKAGDAVSLETIIDIPGVDAREIQQEMEACFENIDVRIDPQARTKAYLTAGETRTGLRVEMATLRRRGSSRIVSTTGGRGRSETVDLPELTWHLTIIGPKGNQWFVRHDIIFKTWSTLEVQSGQSIDQALLENNRSELKNMIKNLNLPKVIGIGHIRITIERSDLVKEMTTPPKAEVRPKAGTPSRNRQ